MNSIRIIFESIFFRSVSKLCDVLKSTKSQTESSDSDSSPNVSRLTRPPPIRKKGSNLSLLAEERLTLELNARGNNSPEGIKDSCNSAQSGLGVMETSMSMDELTIDDERIVARGRARKLR